MIEPTLSSFGLTEDLVASARKLEQRESFRFGCLFFALFPLCMIVGVIWGSLACDNFLEGVTVGAVGGMVYSIVLFGPWLIAFSAIVSRYQPKSSQILEKHRQFIKACEEYESYTRKQQLEAEWRGRLADYTRQLHQRRDSLNDGPEHGPPLSKPAPADGHLLARANEKMPESELDETTGHRVASKSKERPSQDNSESAPGLEGERRLETNYAIVRDKKLRAAAIRIHGRDCCVCGANFDRTYGKNLAKGYIEVHHLKSISAGVRNTNPATDLVPLCANCHKMADRLASQSESPPASIDELKRMLLQKTTASRKPKTSTKSAAVTTKITKASSKPRKTTPDKSL